MKKNNESKFWLGLIRDSGKYVGSESILTIN